MSNFFTAKKNPFTVTFTSDSFESEDEKNAKDDTKNNRGFQLAFKQF